jgi:hypothetical protein
MSWGAQNRSKDAKTPSVGLAMLIKPEPVSCPVQPYMYWAPSWGLTLRLRGHRGGCSVRSTFPTTKTTPAACHDLTTPRLARTSAGAPGVQGPLERGSWGCNAAQGRDGAVPGSSVLK